MNGSCDLAIVGGGPVGATLAAGLGRGPLSVTLIDPKPRGALGSDARRLAVAEGSARLYRALGLWSGELERQATAIAEVHVSRSGRFGFTRLRAEECGVEALGYVVAARALERRLDTALADGERSGRLRRVQAAVESVAQRGRDALVEGRGPDGAPVTVAARLVVGADGAGSAVRRAAGLPLRVHRCDHVAVAGDLVPEHPPRGRAFERFTPWGPLAVLPCGGARATFIWGLTGPDAERFGGWVPPTGPEEGAGAPTGADPAAGGAGAAGPGPVLGKRLVEAFGSRLGALRGIEVRVSHRLRVCHSPRITSTRTVLIGNAANALHPVGAQGFNLGLRDVEALLTVLDEAAGGGRGDPASCLARYRSARRLDHLAARLLTGGLLRVFGSRAPLVPALSAAGLLALDRAGPVKHRFANAAMGTGRMRRAPPGRW